MFIEVPKLQCAHRVDPGYVRQISINRGSPAVNRLYSFFFNYPLDMYKTFCENQKRK